MRCLPERGFLLLRTDTQGQDARANSRGYHARRVADGRHCEIHEELPAATRGSSNVATETCFTSPGHAMHTRRRLRRLHFSAIVTSASPYIFAITSSMEARGSPRGSW